MLERWSKKLAYELVEKELIAPEMTEEYEYALLCMLETAVGISSILLLSLILGKAVPCIFFLAYFLPLRKRTGGYHLASFAGCLLGSLALYGGVYLFTGGAGAHMQLLGILTAVSVVIIWMVGTVNHPNLDMSCDEMRASAKRARIILLVECMLLILMTGFGVQDEIIIHACSGIILCAILVLIAKLTGQEVKKYEEGSIETG